MVAIVINVTAKRVTRLVLESVFLCSSGNYTIRRPANREVEWGVISVEDHSRDLVRYNVDTSSWLREGP